MDNNEKWSFKAKDLITIPNILTYIRIILIVPFVYFFLKENYIPAVICIGVSGLTDCFDGMIARRFNQVTSFGKILDPIADKFTLLAVVICMVIYVPIVLPVLVVLLLKDVLMLLGGMDLINKGITPPAAKWYGKVGTVVFYLSVFAIIFLKAAFRFENFALDVSLLSVTAITMLFALYQYGKIYFQLIREHNSKEKSKENAESK